MRDLSAAELLEIWERGSAQPPTERALTLLRVARPDLETETLADMSIGSRDKLLLSLREATFGQKLASITNCPNCREQLELGFDINQLQRGHPCPPPRESLSAHSFMDGHFEVTFRLPSSRDLAVASGAIDVDSARESLMRCCVLSARQDGQEIETDQMPAQILEKLEEEMSMLDTQANIQVELECPSCRRGWTVAFDILSFFWSELDAWARRMLVEVHNLASAYGWREADILAMSAVRRSIYLNIIDG